MLLFTARPRIMHGAGLRAAGRPPFRRAHGLRPCRRRFAPPGLRPAPTSNPTPTRQKPAGRKNRLQGAGTGPQTKPSCGRFRRAPRRCCASPGLRPSYWTACGPPYADSSPSAGAFSRHPSRRMARTPSHSSRTASSRISTPKQVRRASSPRCPPSSPPQPHTGQPAPQQRAGRLTVGQPVFAVEIQPQQPHRQDHQQVDALRRQLRPPGPYQHQQQNPAAAQSHRTQRPA